MATDVEQRFWARVDKSGDCWEWMWLLDVYGYGHFYFEGKVWGAHRLAYRFSKGPITPGLMVLHTCDYRPCCNPAHLYEGTQGDNVADQVARGRTPAQISTALFYSALSKKRRAEIVAQLSIR